MAGHECYHCKQWIEAGTPHDCWTTTEAALTKDLPEDIRDAWERLRETAAEFGDQRIYASHASIMFARKACYFFVRPKTRVLEVCIFLGRPLNAPQVRRTTRVSRAKLAHLVQIRHRDEVESPITDWIREAYDVSDSLKSAATWVGRPPAGRLPKKKENRNRKKATRKSAKASSNTRRPRETKATGRRAGGGKTKARAGRASARRS